MHATSAKIVTCPVCKKIVKVGKKGLVALHGHRIAGRESIGQCPGAWARASDDMAASARVRIQEQIEWLNMTKRDGFEGDVARLELISDSLVG